jgi:hypothetical protein
LFSSEAPDMDGVAFLLHFSVMHAGYQGGFSESPRTSTIVPLMDAISGFSPSVRMP